MEKVCFKIDDDKYQSCDGEEKSTPISAIERAAILKDAKRDAYLRCKLHELWYKINILSMEEGKKDQKLDKESKAVEKELNNNNDKMIEKYNENKNKAAYDLFWEFSGDEYYKCPYRQTG